MTHREADTSSGVAKCKQHYPIDHGPRPGGWRCLLVPAVLIVGSACSSASNETAASRDPVVLTTGWTELSGTAPTGAPSADQELEREEFTPLIITSIAPDPIPVKGTDDRFHVAYELSVLNDAVCNFPEGG